MLDILSTNCYKILSENKTGSSRQIDIFMTRKRHREDSHFQQVLEDLNIPDLMYAPKFQAFLKDCYDIGLNLQEVWISIQQQQLKFYANMLSQLKISPTITTHLADLLTPQEIFQPFRNIVLEIQEIKRKQDQLLNKVDGLAAAMDTINGNVNTLLMIANKTKS